MEVKNISASFVIITPAHNEDAFIEKTIASIIIQTIRPIRWIVVSDNSTDQTEEIVEKYLKDYDFIRLVTVKRTGERHFANKVRAFNKGLSELDINDYQYIGNLDADISLESDYFQKLLAEFNNDPSLGLAGGMVSTAIGNKYISQEVALDSVAGAVQLFRRKCFEQIGGYIPLRYGGIAAAAEIMVRMNGWRTRTFDKLQVLEHRRTGTATVGIFASKVREGLRFQSLGYGFLFMFLRCIYRLKDRPRIIGSIAVLSGYIYGMIKSSPKALPLDVVKYLRAEQKDKLLRLILR
mgnify:CR=1 FL=1